MYGMQQASWNNIISTRHMSFIVFCLFAAWQTAESLYQDTAKMTLNMPIATSTGKSLLWRDQKSPKSATHQCSCPGRVDRNEAGAIDSNRTELNPKTFHGFIRDPRHGISWKSQATSIYDATYDKMNGSPNCLARMCGMGWPPSLMHSPEERAVARWRIDWSYLSKNCNKRFVAAQIC